MSRFLMWSFTCSLRGDFFADSEAFVQDTINSVRDRLIESWNDNQQFHRDMDSKRVYYLSMEFLMGLSLHLTSMHFFPTSNFLGL
jgi:starch phosphorylase